MASRIRVWWRPSSRRLLKPLPFPELQPPAAEPDIPSWLPSPKSLHFSFRRSRQQILEPPVWPLEEGDPKNALPPFVTRTIQSRRLARLPTLVILPEVAVEPDVSAWAPVPRAIRRRNLTNRRIAVAADMGEILADPVTRFPPATDQVFPIRRRDIERNVVVPFVLPWAAAPPPADAYPAHVPPVPLRQSTITRRLQRQLPIASDAWPQSTPSQFPADVPPKALKRRDIRRRLIVLPIAPEWPSGGTTGEPMQAIPAFVTRQIASRRTQVSQVAPVWPQPAAEPDFPSWEAPLKAHRANFKRVLRRVLIAPIWPQPGGEIQFPGWVPPKALKASFIRRQRLLLPPASDIWPQATPSQYPADIPPRALFWRFRRRLQSVFVPPFLPVAEPDYPSWEPPRALRWRFRRIVQQPSGLPDDLWPQATPSQYPADIPPRALKRRDISRKGLVPPDLSFEGEPVTLDEGDPKNALPPFITRSVRSRRIQSLQQPPWPQPIKSQFPADIPPKALKRRDISRRLLTAKALEAVLALQATPAEISSIGLLRSFKRRDIKRYLRVARTTEAVLGPQAVQAQFPANVSAQVIKRRDISRTLRRTFTSEAFLGPQAGPEPYIPPLLKSISNRRKRPLIGPTFEIIGLILAPETPAAEVSISATRFPKTLRRRDTRRVLRQVRTLEGELSPQATPSQFPADIPPKAIKRRDISRRLRSAPPVDAVLGPQATPTQFPADVPPTSLRRRDIKRRLVVLPTAEGFLGPQAIPAQFPANIPPQPLKRRDIGRRLIVIRTLEAQIATPVPPVLETGVLTATITTPAQLTGVVNLKLALDSEIAAVPSIDSTIDTEP